MFHVKQGARGSAGWSIVIAVSWAIRRIERLLGSDWRSSTRAPSPSDWGVVGEFGD